MKKLLIVKTGENTKTVNEKYGDFEDRIIESLNLDAKDVIVWTAYKEEEKPDLQDVYAIILTGSYSMVSDREPWSVKTSTWLREIEHMGIPTLGICYGHQLLADSLGGKAGYHPKGKEFGTVKIELTEEGKKDPLFSILPEEFLGHVAHSQSVLEMPENATILAKNDFEPYQAFTMNDHIWGVQFHPEFDAQYTLACIDECQDGLVEDGYNIEEVKATVKENDYGKMLLNQFIQLAKEKE